jgi:hypothetical protein
MMIRSEHLEEEFARWPAQWDSVPTAESWRILVFLKLVWSVIDAEYPEGVYEERREKCLRALWILGFELNRDVYLDQRLPELPVEHRGKQIIEDEGPLLFAFYSRDDEEHFATACRDIELALRRRGKWDVLGTETASPTAMQ